MKVSIFEALVQDLRAAVGESKGSPSAARIVSSADEQNRTDIAELSLRHSLKVDNGLCTGEYSFFASVWPLIQTGYAIECAEIPMESIVMSKLKMNWKTVAALILVLLCGVSIAAWLNSLSVGRRDGQSMYSVNAKERIQTNVTSLPGIDILKADFIQYDTDKQLRSRDASMESGSSGKLKIEIASNYSKEAIALSFIINSGKNKNYRTVGLNDMSRPLIKGKIREITLNAFWANDSISLAGVLFIDGSIEGDQSLMMRKKYYFDGINLAAHKLNQVFTKYNRAGVNAAELDGLLIELQKETSGQIFSKTNEEQFHETEHGFLDFRENVTRSVQELIKGDMNNRQFVEARLQSIHHYIESKGRAH